MRPELEKKLFEISPDFFSSRDLPETESLMCFGCECGDGWYAILEELARKMAFLNGVAKSYGVRVCADQIKEKFGDLRVYWRLRSLEPGMEDQMVSTDEDGLRELENLVEDAIGTAVAQSEHTCEWCGKGKDRMEEIITMSGWIQHLCRDCARKKLTDNGGENVIRHYRDGFEFLRFYSDEGIRHGENVYRNFPSLYYSLLCPEKSELFMSIHNPFDAVTVAMHLGVAEDSERAVDVMRNALEIRFGKKGWGCSKNRKLLKGTRGLLLEGRNPFHDNFWGWCQCPECYGKNHFNHYGRLLMELRDRILEEDASDSGEKR